jgi:hypothetical protein
MPRIRFGGLLIVALILGTAHVHAGQKSFYPVNVTNIAIGFDITGSMGSVRNDTSVTEQIGCWTDVVPRDPPDPTGGGIATVWCAAKLNNGQAFGCSSYDAGIVKVASTITSEAYIEFKVYENLTNPNDPKNGTCTYLQVENSSILEPKGP